MARTLNRLSNLDVARKKVAGMYADGGGLYLRVADGGSKQWVFRYVVRGRLRDMGIGPVHTLSLAEARERATDARKLRLDGKDPIDERNARRAALVAASAKAKTFRECAEGFIADNEKKWTSAEHHRQWVSSLEQYAYPELRDLQVDVIDTPLVLKAIKPLWARIPTTAKRVLGRIENVLGWATVHHYRTGDNPARWDGHMEHALPKPKKGEHHPALPYKQAPAYMAKLRENTAVSARVVEFIVLNASRLSEVRFAKWPEIDFAEKLWIVPPERIKGRREHRVPLSDAALAILADMKAIRQSDYIFPGTKPGQPVGRNVPNRVAQRIAPVDITGHGMRSTFKDWASECTSFPNEVSEIAIAHKIKSETERAYRRGDLLQKRAALMRAWADYCGGKALGDNVVAIGGRR